MSPLELHISNNVLCLSILVACVDLGCLTCKTDAADTCTSCHGISQTAGACSTNCSTECETCNAASTNTACLTCTNNNYRTAITPDTSTCVDGSGKYP